MSGVGELTTLARLYRHARSFVSSHKIFLFREAGLGVIPRGLPRTLSHRRSTVLPSFFKSALNTSGLAPRMFIVFESNLWDSSKSIFWDVYSPSLGGFTLWLKGHSCFHLGVELSDVLHFVVVYHCVVVVIITGGRVFREGRCTDVLRGIHFLGAFLFGFV